jgi:hypothetical protein
VERRQVAPFYAHYFARSELPSENQLNLIAMVAI